MAEQKNSWGFTDFLVSGSPVQISVAVMAVVSKDYPVQIEDEEMIFKNADLDGRTKVSLSGENVDVRGSAVCLSFKKPLNLLFQFYQIILCLPASSGLARENEDKSFQILQINNEEKGFGSYFLKIEPDIFFNPVFIATSRKNYQISVIETDDDVQVILFYNVENKDMPSCLNL